MLRSCGMSVPTHAHTYIRLVSPLRGDLSQITPCAGLRTYVRGFVASFGHPKLTFSRIPQYARRTQTVFNQRMVDVSFLDGHYPRSVDLDGSQP